MKWLLLLFVALVATTFGIMFTPGPVRHACQIAFFGSLVLCFPALSTGMFDAA